MTKRIRTLVGIDIVAADHLDDDRIRARSQSIETYVDQDNPDHILPWEKWATRENYEAYLAWRMETGMMDLIAPYIDPTTLRFIHLQPRD